MDWSDIEPAIGMIEAIGIVAALAFTYIEMRRTRVATRLQNYQQAVAQYDSLAQLFIETPVLHSLYEERRDQRDQKDWGDNYQDLDSDRRVRVLYCDAAISLCETVFEARERQQIENDEFSYWLGWMWDLYSSPEFRWTLKWVKDDYGATFIKEVADACQSPDRPSGRPMRRQMK